MTEPITLGFGHFLAQSDGVSRMLLAILILMSVVSWTRGMRISFGEGK